VNGVRGKAESVGERTIELGEGLGGAQLHKRVAIYQDDSRHGLAPHLVPWGRQCLYREGADGRGHNGFLAALAGQVQWRAKQGERSLRLRLSGKVVRIRY
jgi:hypothetical protein